MAEGFGQFQEIDPTCAKFSVPVFPVPGTGMGKGTGNSFVIKGYDVLPRRIVNLQGVISGEKVGRYINRHRTLVGVKDVLGKIKNVDGDGGCWRTRNCECVSGTVGYRRGRGEG